MTTPSPPSLLTPPGLASALQAFHDPTASHDGRQGRFRDDTANLLGADTDFAAIQAFLAEYTDAPATLKVYTKECERLLLWARVARDKPLSSLDRSDYQAYERFLADPQPAARWCGPPKPKWLPDGGFNPRWRPFTGPLAPDSVRHTLGIVNSLLTYLVDAQYLRANPLALARRRRGTVGQPATEPPERYLDEPQWQAVWAALAARPRDTETREKAYQRLRFLLAALYLLAARIGELETHTMGSIREREGRWRWEVTGKGGRRDWVPVGSALLKALRHYRTFLGKTPLPLPTDTTPLLPTLDGTQGITERRAQALLKRLFQEAADRLRAERPEKAEVLRQASPHWLRHTALTHLGQATQDVTLVQRLARHAKLETTGRYLHVLDEQRYGAIATLQVPGEGVLE